MGEPGAERTATGGRLAVFRNRNFLFFFTGQFVSRMGDGIYTLAIVWMMHVLTNSALQISFVVAAGLLPRIFLSPFAGALADRWSKRRTMILTDLVRTAILGGLALLTYAGWATPLSLIVFNCVLAAVSTVFNTSYMAMQKLVTDNDQLLQANSLQQTAQNVTQILGPAVAGVVIGIAGVGAAFAIDAASFLVSAITLLPVRVHEPARNKRPLTAASLFKDVADGTKIAFSFPAMRILLPSMLLYNFFIVAVENVLLVQYIANVLHQGSTALGVVNAAMAVGEMAGGLVLSFGVARWAKDKLLVVNMLITSVAMAAVGITHSVPVVAALGLLGGFCMSFINIGFFTSIQQAVPTETLGTVFGMLGTLFLGVMPLGQVVAGALAAVVAVGPLITAAGLLAALSSCLAFLNPGFRAQDATEKTPLDAT